MCGRFKLEETSALDEIFGLRDSRTIAPRTNICPTQPVEVVRDNPHTGIREMLPMVWGLIPSWSKDTSMAAKMFNARAETAHEKPSFKNALRRRRCLIPSDGFYEWDPATRPKQCYQVSLKSGEVFGLAGLWETWCGPQGEEIDSCSILTLDANELLRPFHHRMPVIIPRDRMTNWLDRTMEDYKDIHQFLLQYPAEEMAAFPLTEKLKPDTPAFFSESGMP